MKPTVAANLSPELVIFLEILTGIAIIYILGDIFWQMRKSKRRSSALLKNSCPPPPRIPNREKLQRYQK